MLKRMRSRLAFNLVAAFIIILLLFSLLTSAIGYLQFSGALNAGTHAVPVELTHEGVNGYFVEVTPSPKGKPAFRGAIS